MKKILHTLILALAILILLPGIAKADQTPAPTAPEPVGPRPSQVLVTQPQSATTITAPVRLLTRTDHKVACLTMSRLGEYTIEKIDFSFKYKMDRRWYVVQVAEDGFQFTVVPVPQNPPWACIPLKYRVKVPASWADQ